MVFSITTLKWQHLLLRLFPILLLMIAGRPVGAQQTIRRTVPVEGIEVITRIADAAQTSPHLLVIAAQGPHQITARAADQLLGWPLLKGRLSVVTGDNPNVIESVINKHPQALVLRLQELWDQPGSKTPPGPAAVLYAPSLETFAQAMCPTANQLIERKADRLELVAADDRLRTITINTRVFREPVTENEMPDDRLKYWRPAQRLRQFRWAAAQLLVKLEMLPASIDPDRFLPGATVKGPDQRKPILVAIYDGPGTGAPMPLAKQIETMVPGAWALPVGPEEVRGGTLDSFDVVVFAGGMASQQYDALAGDGRRKVRKWVDRGGGFVGLCAGGFLASARPYRWGLDLLDARIVDHDHWARGTGLVELELSQQGERLFKRTAEPSQVKYHYGNGPIWAPADRDDLDDYQPLAWFRSGLGQNGADPQIMVNTPAIIAGQFGKGRVVASSGHAEWTEGIEDFLGRYIEQAVGKRPKPP